MRQTVAILGSWDTKQTEMRYMRGQLERAGLSVTYVDVSTLPHPPVPSQEGVDSTVLRAESLDEWNRIVRDGRAAQIQFMSALAKNYIAHLQEEGRIQGIISAGGLQNTTLAVAAMEGLPFGFPKVLATTVASGYRTFVSVLKNLDIVVIPALADIAGLNFVTKSTLDTACDCLAGMLLANDSATRSREHLRVGVSMMGVTNLSAEGALNELRNLNYEAIGFHTTGAGGAMLERLVRSGDLDAVLDINLHEIVNEYFGGGYSFGTQGRLEAAIELGLPLVVAPGGLDFVDYYVADFPGGIESRKYVLHNGSLAHIKLTESEACDVGAIVGERLSQVQHKIVMIVPTNGLRSESAPGEAMYDPEVDNALVRAIQSHCGRNVEIKKFDGCLNSPEFGRVAARELNQQISTAAASSAVCSTSHTHEVMTSD
jgi:uncharacterized protein (UPF0261 family)